MEFLLILWIIKSPAFPYGATFVILLRKIIALELDKIEFVNGIRCLGFYDNKKQMPTSWSASAKIFVVKL